MQLWLSGLKTPCEILVSVRHVGHGFRAFCVSVSCTGKPLEAGMIIFHTKLNAAAIYRRREGKVEES